MQSSSPREMTFAVAIVLIVGWLFVNLTSLSREYPHYFQWDMDLTSTIDGLMLGSGQMPAHINHTGFGMYLLHAATIKLARQTDTISVSSLEEVSDSLDPLSGVSELTTFLRLHSPYVGAAFVLLVWAALSILFRPTRLVSIMALAVLSTMTALLYHATLIRTEFYAVLFWSGALFLVGLAVRAGRPRNTLFWIFGAGVLLGICFLSKIQALFYVAGLPLFLLLGLHHGSDAALRPTEAAGEKRRARITLVVSGLNALLISLLLMEANRVPLPLGLGVFEYGNPTGTLELAPYATLLVVSLIGIFFAQWIFIRQGWLESGLFQFLGLLSWLAAGFTASFLLHFVVLSPPDLAYTYLLLDAKMLFFRGSYYDIRPFSAYLADAAVIVRHTAWPLGCHLFLLAILVAGALRSWIAISLSQLLVLVSATSLLFLQILLATRPIMRDMIFVEPLADILTLVFVMVIVQKGIRHRAFLTVVCVIVMTTLIGSNLLYASRPQQDLDFNGSQYGWQPGRWFSQVYFAQDRFSLLMSGRYPIESRVLAQEQAIREAEVRRTTDFVFQNQTVTHRNTGPLAVGFPVWAAHPDWKVASLSDGLQASFVVDNGALETRSDTSWNFSEGPDLAKGKIAKPGHITALDRSDLDVYLFVEPNNIRHLRSPTLSFDPSLRVSIDQAGAPRNLRALRVVGLAEVPAEEIEGEFFFVVRPISGTRLK